jgi:hypothetical protein
LYYHSIIANKYEELIYLDHKSAVIQIIYADSVNNKKIATSIEPFFASTFPEIIKSLQPRVHYRAIIPLLLAGIICKESFAFIRVIKKEKLKLDDGKLIRAYKISLIYPGAAAPSYYWFSENRYELIKHSFQVSREFEVTELYSVK